LASVVVIRVSVTFGSSSDPPEAQAMHGAGVVAAAVLGYLLGSLPSADLASRIATTGRVDLRRSGSGNPGATNAAEVLGARWGIAVLVIDIAKGVAAAFVGRALAGDIGAYTGATLAIVGHIVPPWSRFRGGKGAATSAGACLAVFPVYFPIYIALAAIVAKATHRAEFTAQVSGGAWVAASIAWWAASLPNGWGPQPGLGLPGFTVASTAMILAKFAVARKAPQSA
jgi:glycerol-3-phosphate acyltransferase PlsY